MYGHPMHTNQHAFALRPLVEDETDMQLQPHFPLVSPESCSATIHPCTRAQAIADGLLVDLSEMARRAGFGVPVALTRALWLDCLEWEESTGGRKDLQAPIGPLWNLMLMACQAVRGNPCARRLQFQIYRIPGDGRGNQPHIQRLTMLVGRGDSCEWVVTIALPGEG